MWKLGGSHVEAWWLTCEACLVMVAQVGSGSQIWSDKGTYVFQYACGHTRRSPTTKLDTMTTDSIETSSSRRVNTLVKTSTSMI